MSMLSFCALLLLGFLQNPTNPQPAASAAATQANPPAIVGNSPTSSDPVERLEIARRVNGLSGSDVKPWHVKASYEVLGSDGKPKDKGTFEEWWVSEERYKLSYQGTAFSQEEYGTDHGVFHTGDREWPTGPLRLVRRSLVKPIPDREDVQDSGHLNLERKFGKVVLACTALSYDGRKQADEDSPSLCFEPTRTILVYENDGNRLRSTVFDHFIQFRNRYVARDRILLSEGRPALTLHIDQLESLDDSGREPLTPPGNARPVTKRVSLSGIESGHYALKKVSPEYPITPKMQNVEGQVILWATFDQKGRVIEVHDFTGPEPLQKEATDAVRRVRYRPYLQEGKAVEFETEMQVIVSLGPP